MTVEEIRKLTDEYIKWLNSKISLRQFGEWIEITTPYLDRHNDYIQIYVKKTDNGYLLTDDGYTLSDLEDTGFIPNTAQRKSLLMMTLNGLGVQLQGQSLQVRTTIDNFVRKKHDLIQAILAVNDMFYMSPPIVARIFIEDVTTWLERNSVRYISGVKFTGKSGLDHMFSFVIPKSNAAPERMIQAVNHPDRNAAKALAFAWIDTRDARSEGATAYALLNDSQQTVLPSVLTALKEYDINPLLWSKRDRFVNKLAA